MSNKHTAFIVEALCFHVNTETSHWAKVAQKWHSTHATLEAAETTVNDLKTKDNVVALAIIEWTAQSPIQHGSHALRNCAIGMSQIAVYHADRTYVPTNSRVYASGHYGNGVAHQEVFVGNDWTDQSLSGSTFTGEARLTPRNLPDHLKNLAAKKAVDLHLDGQITFKFNECYKKDDKQQWSTNITCTFKNESELESYVDGKKSRYELRVIEKTVLEYSDEEKDFILNTIANGKYI